MLSPEETAWSRTMKALPPLPSATMVAARLAAARALISQERIVLLLPGPRPKELDGYQPLTTNYRTRHDSEVYLLANVLADFRDDPLRELVLVDSGRGHLAVWVIPNTLPL